MGAYRDFDAARAERVQLEALHFKLAGTEFETQTFLPALPVLDMAALTEESTEVEALRVISDLLLAMVLPEQHEQMRAALTRVGFTTLFSVAAWIIEEVTGRPLSSVSSSPEPLSWSSPPSSSDSPPLAAVPST